VLNGLKTHLMQPDLVKEFIAEYHRELNRATAECAAAHELRQEELARVERQIRAIHRDGQEGPADALHEGRAAGAGGPQGRARPRAGEPPPPMVEADVEAQCR
jgi:hypothetical protein